MAISKKGKQNNKYLQRCRKWEPLRITGRNVTRCSRCGRLYRGPPPPPSPTIRYRITIWSRNSTSGNGTTTKNWKQKLKLMKRKQSRYPRVDERINEMWYLHTTPYYSGVRRKEILTCATTDRAKRNKPDTKSQCLCDSTYWRYLRGIRFIEIESQGLRGERREEWVFTGCGVGMMTMFWIRIVGVIARHVSVRNVIAFYSYQG